MGFTHLHVHTEYSLLDGSSRIGELVKKAASLGQKALAITDHGNMYGVIDFYRACLKEGIKPIIGCEVYVAPRSRFEKEAGTGEDKYYHLILLAENQTGYENLVKIVSAGFIEGYYYKPRVDKEVLEKYHEGIIASSACLAGEVARCLKLGQYEMAKEAALSYAKIFGPDHFYLELQDHGLSEQKGVNQGLLRLSQETGLPLIATNDVHYVEKEDWEAHDVLLCIQTAKKTDDTDRMRYEPGQFYLRSEEEMENLFVYAKEALENTGKIAERCNVTIEFGHYKLPKYEVPEGYTSESYLRKLCTEGLTRRYPVVTEELSKRLEYELSTIIQMGFVDYFLIVWDFIHYARENGIPVGPGRGSAAGSVVAYACEITDVDPLAFDLLFERFLNPERVTMPDIDVDFCYERRQEVIAYVSKKYGEERVSQIITFGTMAARGVIRDVGRALNLPYSLCDTVAKEIPAKLPDVKVVTIDDALKVNTDLRKMAMEDQNVATLLQTARKLEGLPRHSSVHAAGVVIAPEAIENFVPLSRGSDGNPVTQYTMTTLEELGLLKMDFLGLRTLTVIADAVRLIEKNRGFVLDIKHLPLDDPEVFAYIGTGKTDGIFQLESAGMKSFMKELKPECIEDVIAGIALYRPGPMDFIPQYLSGKRNRESIVYETPELEPILASTYGCIVYQEQVMQIVRNLAGYSYGRSDLVRRAMSKKKAAVMEQERQNFVYGNEKEGVPGCVKRGIDERKANHIYDTMTDFAKYAFNKSHAAAYAVVTYQTAYLKYYYPQEFMAALMTSVTEFPAKTAGYIASCRKEKMRVLPPDINRGESGFTVVQKDILYGLASIKSIGKNVVNALVSEREENGPYRNLEDLIRRMYPEVNKRVLEALILSGATDALPGNRRQKMEAFPKILENVSRQQKDQVEGQMSLFDMMGEEDRITYTGQLLPFEEYEPKDLLAYEKEALGIYVSGHPLEAYSEILSNVTTATCSQFMAEEGKEGEEESEASQSFFERQEVVIGGVVAKISIKSTKKGDMMAFVTLEDMTGSAEVIFFPKVFEQYRSLIKEEEKLLIKGQVSLGEESHKLLATECVLLSQVTRKIWVRYENSTDYEEKTAQREAFLTLTRKGSGTDQVISFLTKENMLKAEQGPFAVSEEAYQSLSDALGTDNVKMTFRTGFSNKKKGGYS